MKIYILAIASFFGANAAFAQVNESKTEYREIALKRAEKIVAGLSITDSVKFKRVTNVVAGQYEFLNNIQSQRDAQKKVIKEKVLDNTVAEQQIKLIDKETTSRVDSLHPLYLNRLKQELTAEQIEKVKDGMTYGVLPITYKGYQAMLPTLTTEQKATILAMLTEAREKAMDAGSSDEKHKWFGKYKGRINNYLAAQGYDLKKASEESQARRPEGGK